MFKPKVKILFNIKCEVEREKEVGNKEGGRERKKERDRLNGKISPSDGSRGVPLVLLHPGGGVPQVILLLYPLYTVQVLGIHRV